MMFEQPRKGDIDYALSTLMHDALRQIAEQRNSIKSDASKHGALNSSRVLVMIADAADNAHAGSVAQAKQVLVDFVPRVGQPATVVTAWARPHLENLSNAVLTEIPAHGFPDDHKRLTDRYRAVFQQRIDGALRDVEIGYVKGAGFSTAAPLPEADEWLRAAEALALLGMGHAGIRVICKRANAGMIKARAELLTRNGAHVGRDIDVFPGFWWAQGEAALNQNWDTGDFDTWIDQKFHLEAFGVAFRRADIERAKPTPSPAPHESPHFV